ncbi:MAG TPA: hypothetical protein VFO86_02780 [Terriglobia bacterium]|nr:hypothetical protein [Terriglobia bacterium]
MGPQQETKSIRNLKIQGGRVLVEREGSVDHVSIFDLKDELTSDSWCPLETGGYDELSSFFKQFVTAVKSGNAESVSSLVRYPLRVNGTPRLTIPDQRSFVRRYAEVFDSAVLKKVQAATPEAIFCRNGQAMIGDGLLWAHAEKSKVALDVVNR